MKKALLAGTAAAALAAAAPALGADLPARVYTKAPPVYAPIYNWTGFYIGGSIGGRWADIDGTTVFIAPGPGPTFPGTASASYDSSTVRAGGYVGYNWQFSPSIVIGVEGDIAWGNGSASVATIPGAFFPGAPVFGSSSSVRHRWDASARGRIGWLVTPAVMLYATGGAAWQNLEASANCTLGDCQAALSQTNSTTRLGWTIGGGIETLVWNNWTARIEYRFADYGVWRTSFFGAPTALPLTVVDVDVRTHTGLFGLAYKF
jgi:outer membrane immunogenic protein